MTLMALSEGRHGISARQVCGAASLRAWLADRWAILFSRPDDFAQEHLEMDRWLSVLSRSFRARGVVPMALARNGSDAGQGWLGRLAGLDREAAAVLTLDAPLGTVADLAAGALRAEIARGGPRFALILDSSLRC